MSGGAAQLPPEEVTLGSEHLKCSPGLKTPEGEKQPGRNRWESLPWSQLSCSRQQGMGVISTPLGAESWPSSSLEQARLT